MTAHLTPNESRLFDRLARARGRVVPIDELARELGYTATLPADRQVVRQHLSNLRHKVDVEISPFQGQGYRIGPAPTRGRKPASASGGHVATRRAAGEWVYGQRVTDAQIREARWLLVSVQERVQSQRASHRSWQLSRRDVSDEC